MAVTGEWTWLDRAEKKIADGTINLTTDTFKALLLGSAQALSASFVGASGDARKADLTAELATASGYTAGGVALTSVSLSRISATVNGWGGLFGWTLSGTITVKYVALFSDTATNDDLLAFLDMDTGGGTITPTTGAFNFAPDTNGYLSWSR